MNGVGGRTIAEAKATISYNEYLTWIKYRAERGSLFVGRRVEQSVGRLHHATVAMKVKQGTRLDIYDYLPHEPKPQPVEMDSIEAFRKFAGV